MTALRITFYLLVAVAAVIVAIIASLMFPMPSDSKTEQAPPATQKPAKRPCKTVTPKVYNKRVKVLDKLTGRRHHKASRKVCKSHYRKLGKRVQKARADCYKSLSYATASHYGRGDGFAGGPLACGGNLYAGQIGTAHKTLPCGTILYFKKASGGMLRVPVIDRGPYIAGREFDLTSWTADVVGGFDGVGTVRYGYRNCSVR